jgi:type IV pilus assembly protein PilA
LIAASSAKNAIAEYVNLNSALPGAADVTVETQNSTYVSGVSWDGAKIIATAQGEPKITGKTIELTAALNASANQVNWSCAGTIDAKYRPGSCK